MKTSNKTNFTMNEMLAFSKSMVNKKFGAFIDFRQNVVD